MLCKIEIYFMKLSPAHLSIIERINAVDVKFHRDLLALLFSPFVFKAFFPKYLLFTEGEFSDFEEVWDWFKQIENEPFPKELNKLRLGKYAEELLYFHFTKSPKYDALGHNLQLIDGKLTVGEIDYLLKDKNQNEFIHLELAIKFFLKIEINGENQWIGPSTKDNLTKKRNKLLQHQLQLTTTHKQLIPTEFQQINFAPKLLLKGAEFIHFDAYQATPNPFTNAWWLHVEHLERLEEPNFQFVIVPNRKDWIFPFNRRLEKYQFAELKHEIRDFLLLQNEILVARFDSNENPLDRGFVVRANWPF